MGGGLLPVCTVGESLRWVVHMSIEEMDGDVLANRDPNGRPFVMPYLVLGYRMGEWIDRGCRGV